MFISESAIDFENPCSLFKYRAFDRNALQTLIDAKVWIAAPKSFNDPFDCRFYIYREHSDEELLAHLNDCAESRGDTRRFTLEDIPQERPHFKRALATLEEGVRNAGLFCLAATPFEPLMWAHYADGHRGFCIEYERRPDNDLGASGCSKVIYVDPTFPIFRGLDFFRQPEDVLRGILTCKAGSWSYEHEWRLIRMWRASPGERSYRLNARILSIYFGLRMPRRDALTVIRVLRHCTGIEFYEMVTPQERLALQAAPFRFSEEELDT
jgi:Protein of unknown function (DUF2971)